MANALHAFTLRDSTDAFQQLSWYVYRGKWVGEIAFEESAFCAEDDDLELVPE